MDGLTALIIVFVVFVITASVAFSVYTVMFPVRTATDRLDTLTAAAEVGTQQAAIVSDAGNTPLDQILSRLGQYAQQQGKADEEATEKLRATLRHAGYRSRRAIEIYNGVRVAAFAFAPVLASPLIFVLERQAVLLSMLIAAAVGYYGPGIYVQNAAQKRQGELLKAYPDALDLLVSCVDAGLSLDQAFRRVAVEMNTVAPGLAREFSMVNSEISAGVERGVALKHLEERTGLEEVRSLVNMLAQAERFGSSIADSLRMYSSVAREKRMSRAEEAAGKVGSKLTVVMIVFFLPVLMVILMMPSLIRMFWMD